MKRPKREAIDAEGATGLDRDEAWVVEVRERLAAWYATARRPLPWRDDRDPYRVLVSEMMLIQTTVAAVVPYFERFLKRFPDVFALARADEAEVIKAWEGLGYYRRARQLHAAARQIVELHGGCVPDDPAAVRALPGVGRYVAGAILSFAFDRPEPILEANTRRALARLLAVRENVKLPKVEERLWSAAARLAPPHGAGDFNQALMDLGALVCTPSQPSCLVCPLAALCRARSLGLQDVLPVAAARPAALASFEACVIIRRDDGGQRNEGPGLDQNDAVLIVQRGPGRLWEGFWEFPTVHISGADPAGRSFGEDVDLTEGARRLTGLEVELGPRETTIRYSVTRHRVALDVHRGRAAPGALRPGPGLVDAQWVAPERLAEKTFSSAGRRAIAWLTASRSPETRTAPRPPRASRNNSAAP